MTDPSMGSTNTGMTPTQERILTHFNAQAIGAEVSADKLARELNISPGEATTCLQQLAGQGYFRQGNNAGQYTWTGQRQPVGAGRSQGGAGPGKTP